MLRKQRGAYTNSLISNPFISSSRKMEEPDSVLAEIVVQ
uniref:Uncharacterized protein n=1 Tax=Elizabethkingia anophelis TaxID=1117645 RepID=A0A455ZEF3_9FLAO|nr:TPA_exp: hypothetical protein [Elizabethkingia anophelis]